MMTDTRGTSTLRTDARRNVDRIRAAAVEVFREQGLSASLETVAAVAGVSKGTVFNRFGGRAGLIDAVLDDVVAAELLGVIESTRSIPAVLERITYYVRALRDLQYRVPAVNDVLLQEFPDSEELMILCHAGGAIHDDLVEDGHAAGVLAQGVTPDDLHVLTINNALALKHGARPSREDYDRRTGFVLGGICPSAQPSAQRRSTS
ncbi:TetR family transcriptional regulator [Brachybacterium sp. P6-10-X1]|uniref:TetR/AcrR family transcriptional regulator n=1 Tax=Brachybacterium sp. P6-10-X1 TaxID=1903186 RepID=UPI000971AEA1|nr:TetR/AcrR family transcriptional regulator [Brachybacterium sp. P6-10-X1]APX32809.1 TetR family transcriptional regulator [Brachybacterium sp. P6-10-X1]